MFSLSLSSSLSKMEMVIVPTTWNRESTDAIIWGKHVMTSWERLSPHQRLHGPQPGLLRVLAINAKEVKDLNSLDLAQPWVSLLSCTPVP